MIRTLFIIAGAGLVLAAACFGGVLALGGRELMQHGWNLTFYEGDDWRDDEVRVDAGGPQATRTLEWAGAEAVTIDVAADVAFTQADEPRLEVTGPAGLVERLVIEDGRLGLADAEGDQLTFFGGRQRLRVTMAAPAVRQFTLNGSGDLSIEGYEQDDLTVALNGSGDVDVRGRARRASLEVAGSGDIDAGALQAEDARIRVEGSGSVAANPSGAADVAISGSGDVRLLSQPARLASQVDGSGDIRVDD